MKFPFARRSLSYFTQIMGGQPGVAGDLSFVLALLSASAKPLSANVMWQGKA